MGGLTGCGGTGGGNGSGGNGFGPGSGFGFGSGNGVGMGRVGVFACDDKYFIDAFLQCGTATDDSPACSRSSTTLHPILLKNESIYCLRSEGL